MPNPAIAQRRLTQQCLAASSFTTPAEVVAWFGAVQAQDYLASLWAVGLRLPEATETAVEQAIADRSIVRLWFMRGTIHLLPGPDLRGMLQLMAPRMRRLLDNVTRANRAGLDADAFARSAAALTAALRGGNHLTRAELAGVLAGAGLPTEDSCLSFLLQRAQADGLICSASRNGKQHTFALLDDWLPLTTSPSRDDALATFTRRYFRSHGPATLQDFVWWSGFPVTEARAALEAVAPELQSEMIGSQTYLSILADPPTAPSAPVAYLLPNYDEYVVGYRDRDAVFDPEDSSQLGSRGNVLFENILVLDGIVTGTWKRSLTKSAVRIILTPFRPLEEPEQHAVAAAADRYGHFLSLTVSVDIGAAR